MLPNPKALSYCQTVTILIIPSNSLFCSKYWGNFTKDVQYHLVKLIEASPVMDPGRPSYL